jgi:hypothetical protein
MLLRSFAGFVIVMDGFPVTTLPDAALPKRPVERNSNTTGIFILSSPS